MSRIISDNFPCFRCGVCCRKYQVRITAGEARNIAAKLGLDITDFVNKYTDPRWPGRDSFLLRHQDDGCIFLKTEPDGKITGCSIHSFRPQDCRDWTAGPERPECQRGLLNWELTVKDGKISGDEAALNKFDSFIDSL